MLPHGFLQRPVEEWGEVRAMSSVPRWLKVLWRLRWHRRDRERLNQTVQSFRAADEALEAGDVDRALELLDSEATEGLLAEPLLDDSQHRNS
jgi:hypothetical protein